MRKEIKTKRLTLRPLSVQDLEAVHLYSADEENTRYMTMLPNKSKQETLQFLKSVTEQWEKKEPTFLQFGIEYEKKIIGSIGIYLNDQQTKAELGWILNKNYWNQGLMTEAALAVKEYAQNELELDTLEAHCDTDNIASATVMQNIGMTLVFNDGPRYYEKTGKKALETKYILQLPKTEKRLLLEEALTWYGLENAETVFIRHNENITFQVAGRYLLRIHKRINGFHEGTTHEGLDRTKLRRQELQFLKYINSSGINVQKPIPNKNGEQVTILSNGVPVTMLTWIEGYTVEEKGCTLQLAEQIGEMTAKLHQAGREYEEVLATEAGKKRNSSNKENNGLLHYDEHLCQRLRNRLFEVADSCHFSEDYRDSMAGALDVIANMLKETKKDAILVHSDLSLSNLLVTEGGIVPIDFSLFGYCHPMMDLGGLFCNMNGVDQRRAVADGYRRAGGKIDYHALDCCFALDILLGVITHCESWAGQDWFIKRMRHWCGETFGPLANGKEIFTSDYIMLNTL